MNPVLPIEHSLPDSEALFRVDDRLYRYGARAIAGFPGSFGGPCDLSSFSFSS